MRSLIITILILVLVKAVSSQVLTIPYGNSITNDGLIGATEWIDADTVLIQSSSSTTTSVLFKHDGQNFCIAFVGNLQSPFFYFPELSIDANFDRSNVYQQDDWWFHVSATDCEYQGAYGNYNNCQAVRPNWTANPNFNSSGPSVNRVELSIPFQTIGVQPDDTIGILFYLNNFQNFRYHLSTATHLDPSSWAVAHLEPIITGLSHQSSDIELKVFPNPSTSFFTLDLSEVEATEIRIMDISGKIVFELPRVQNSIISVDLSAFSKGIYFLETISGKQIYRKKLIRN